jgi:hypothetical protein
MNYLFIGHEKIRRRFHERFLARAMFVIVAAILKSAACPGATARFRLLAALSLFVPVHPEIRLEL